MVKNSLPRGMMQIYYDFYTTEEVLKSSLLSSLNAALEELPKPTPPAFILVAGADDLFDGMSK